MKDYKVVWEIELSADDPRDAAQKALDWIVDPKSQAHVFDVYEFKPSKRSCVAMVYRVDLNNGV